MSPAGSTQPQTALCISHVPSPQSQDPGKISPFARGRAAHRPLRQCPPALRGSCPRTSPHCRGQRAASGCPSRRGSAPCCLGPCMVSRVEHSLALLSTQTGNKGGVCSSCPLAQPLHHSHGNLPLLGKRKHGKPGTHEPTAQLETPEVPWRGSPVLSLHTRVPWRASCCLRLTKTLQGPPRLRVQGVEGLRPGPGTTCWGAGLLL